MNDVVKYIDTSMTFNDTPYTYDGRYVPRVTHILESMWNDQYLIPWANKLGLYQRKEYNAFSQSCKDIGTQVHEAISNMIIKNEDLFDKINYDFLNTQVTNSYSAFKQWWSNILKQNYRVIFSEKELACKYYGGTLDLLIEINGKTYLVDFKTSKQNSPKYTLQLAAYRHILESELYNIKVDGCIVLLLSKQTGQFTEYLYDLDVEANRVYFDYCTECFLSLVYAYYLRKRVEHEYSIL